MANHLTDDERNSLIADHKTGNFSQRKLSTKYKVSLGYVNKTIKEIDKIDEEVVNAGIAYKTALSERDEHSVNAIEQVVNEKTKHLQFINNLTLKNLSVMAKKVNEETSINEHKMIGETVHKAGQTLGVIDQFAPKIELNNTNAQQNNNMTKEEIMQAVSEVLPN